MVNETIANLSAAVNGSAKNATGRPPSTPEGMFVAYSSLVVMALLPIFFGSFRSVKCLIEQKVCCLTLGCNPCPVNVPSSLMQVLEAPLRDRSFLS